MAIPGKSPAEKALDNLDKRKVDVFVTYHYQWEGALDFGEAEEAPLDLDAAIQQADMYSV